MIELIKHTSNSIFRKKSHTKGFPKSGHTFQKFNIIQDSVSFLDSLLVVMDDRHGMVLTLLYM